MSHVSQSALWWVGELNAGAPKKATTIACHAVFTSLLSTILICCSTCLCYLGLRCVHSTSPALLVCGTAFEDF